MPTGFPQVFPIHSKTRRRSTPPGLFYPQSVIRAIELILGILARDAIHRESMILLEGSEMWEYADRTDLTVKTPYDPEADIEWLSGHGSRIQMKPGMFYLVYPDDGHKPCCHEKEQTSYRKVVVKIKIDSLLHGVPKMEKAAVYGKGDRRWI
mgnify:CR=1 FL=1